MSRSVFSLSTAVPKGNPDDGLQTTGAGSAVYGPPLEVNVRGAVVWAGLAGIMLLGLAIRLCGLTGYGIFWDEAYHVQLVQLPNVGAMLDAVLSNPPSDPLYALALRAWAGVFGTGDAAIRGLSVVCSVLTIPATYLLGRVLAGPKVGLLGALLFALSPYALELGQEGALYALAALTITLTLAAGWRWRTDGRGELVYVLLGIVAIYSHYVAAAILGLFAILAWIPAAGPHRVRENAWMGAHVLILCAWMPWLLGLAIHWFDNVMPRVTILHRATPGEVAGALVQFTSGSAALLTGRHLLEAGGLVAGGGLLVAGWLAGWQEHKRGLRVMLAISGIIFIVPALASGVSGLWLFVPHFMVFLLPAFLCALSAGALDGMVRGAKYPLPRKLAPRVTRHWVLGTRLAVGGLLVVWLGAQAWGLVLFNKYPPHGADGLRELAAVLRSESRPDDTVLIMPPVLTPPVQQYYGGPIHGLPANFNLREIYLPFGDADWNIRARTALDTNVRGYSRFWLIYYSADDFKGDFLRGVTTDYEQLGHYHYPFADLYLFR